MLKKLSLAALVAMGSMSVASATPLTEAIKNVDLNGMLRLRYYNVKTDSSQSIWRTNGIFIFKVPVAENIKFVFRNSTQTYLLNTESNDGNLKPVANVKAFGVDSTMANNLLFMNVNYNGLNAIVGKIPVATPITSVDPATPSHGAGAIATYNVGNGVTLAAAYVEALKNASYASPEWGEAFAKTTNSYPGNTINNDIYALAAIYGGNGVKAQAWYFTAENLLKHDYVLSADVDVSKLANLEGVTVGVHADFASSKLDDTAINAVGAALDGTEIADAYEEGGYDVGTKNFYNINVKAGNDFGSLKLGYAKTNKKIGVVHLSVDSPLAGQADTWSNYDIANLTDAKMFYATACFKPADKVSAKLAYSHTKADAVQDKNKDYTVKVGYAYTKKLSFSALYDHSKWDSDDKATKQIVLEAKYSF
jgi:hypothetical protein